MSKETETDPEIRKNLQPLSPWIGFGVLLAFLMVGGGLFYQQWQQNQLEKGDLQQDLVHLKNKIHVLSDSSVNHTLQTKVTQLEESLKTYQQALEKLGSQLEQFDHQFQSLQSGAQEQWATVGQHLTDLEQHFTALKTQQTEKSPPSNVAVFSEPELQRLQMQQLFHLTEMHWRLKQQKEVSLLLQEIKTKTDDPSLRQAVANDLNALSEITPPNASAVWDSITKLQTQLPTLPFLSQNFSKSTPDQDEKAKPLTRDLHEKNASFSSTASRWKKELEESWHELKSLVKIRRSVQSDSFVISSLEKELLIQRIMNLLEACRVAGLQGERALYKKGLIQLKKQIRIHYDLKSPRVKAYLHQIDRARRLPLQSTWPECLESLALFESKQQG